MSSARTSKISHFRARNRPPTMPTSAHRYRPFSRPITTSEWVCMLAGCCRAFFPLSPFESVGPHANRSCHPRLCLSGFVGGEISRSLSVATCPNKLPTRPPGQSDPLPPPRQSVCKHAHLKNRTCRDIAGPGAPGLRVAPAWMLGLGRVVAVVAGRPARPPKKVGGVDEGEAVRAALIRQ